MTKMEAQMRLSVLAVISIIMCGMLWAAPPIHEGFEEYPVGNALSGQAGGRGFSAAWKMPVDGISAKVVAGLSLGNLPVSGNAASFSRTGALNAKRFAFRPIASVPVNQEIWMSYLSKWTKDNGGDGHSAELGIGTLMHQDDGAMNLFTNVLTINKADRFAIGYNESKLETSADSNLPGKTVLVVARWAGIGTQQQQATLWLFDKAEAVNAVLNANKAETLDEHAFNKQTIDGSMGTFGEGFGLKIGGYIGGNPGSYEVTFDEIRLGSSSADVLPGSSIPVAKIETPKVVMKELKPLPIGSRTIYVAPNGNDNSSDPTSIDTPLRTIQKAASIVKAGETILIRGGTYRETVTAQLAASKENPILIRPYKNEKVVVSGAELVKGPWKKEGTIYVTDLNDTFESSINQAEQLFVDGHMLHYARTPSTIPFEHFDPDHKFQVSKVIETKNVPTGTEGPWGRVRPCGSMRAVFTCDEMTEPDGTWTGATVHMIVRDDEFGGWGFGQVGPVLSHKNGQLEVLFYSMRESKPDQIAATEISPGEKFYIFGKKAALDDEGEWFHDEKAGKIYVRLPNDADPNKHTIEVKRRDYAFDLSNSAHVTVKDLDIFAATVTTDKAFLTGEGGGGWSYSGRGANEASPSGTGPAHHITLDGLRAKYVMHFIGTWGFAHGQWCRGGIMLVGQDHVLKNSNIEYSAGNGVSLYGYRHKVLNNIVSNTNYSGAHAGAIATSQTHYQPKEVKIRPTDIEIAHNTIYRTAFDGIQTQAFESSTPENRGRIHHNFIDTCGLLNKDMGSVKFIHHHDKNQKVVRSRIDHNLIRGVHAALGHGIYFDFADGFIVDHNIVWDVNDFININDGGNMLIANNTGIAYSHGIGGMIRGGGNRFWNLERIEIRNNITNQDITQMDKRDPRVHESFQQSHNLAQIDPAEFFVDPDRGDFRLKPGSKAVDAGVKVDGYTGDAPDIGAIENGDDSWVKTVGADRQIVKAPTRLTGRATPDGFVELQWQDNADNELGYVIECGSETGYMYRNWEFSIIGRTRPDATSFRGKVPSPMRDNFFRVRAVRSYYSNTITLNAGVAHLTMTFEPEQGYEPGYVNGRLNWHSVEGGRGLINGSIKAGRGYVWLRCPWIRVAKSGQNQHLIIDGTEDRVSIAALGNIRTLLPAFDPARSKLRFRMKIGLTGYAAEAKKEAVVLRPGNLGYWQGPGGGIAMFVLDTNGDLKWHWKKIVNLKEYAKPGELVEFSGVFDFATKKFSGITANGQALKNEYQFDYKDSTLQNALLQIEPKKASPEHAVLLDDITFELVDDGMEAATQQPVPGK